MIKRLIFAATTAVMAVIALWGASSAGTKDGGVIVCVNDKWDETEPEKGHKFVEYAGRCVKVPDDTSAAKVIEQCSGNYEYLPDSTWKGSGSCTATFADGDQVFSNWEENSAAKAWPYKVTGGTGKYKDANGGGTYFYENLNDSLAAGRYSGTW